MKYILFLSDCKFLDLKKYQNALNFSFYTSMLCWHFKSLLGVFGNKYKGFLFKYEIVMNSIANNQMSHSCGHIEPLFGPKIPFFIGVIAIYFSPFFFDHPVYLWVFVSQTQIQETVTGWSKKKGEK